MADHDTDRDLLDALKGYYDAFIGIDDPKGFFYGLAEYIEFIDRVPVFEQFAAELYAKRKPYEERCAELEQPALKRLEAIKKELADYVAKHKIQNAVIGQALKEYEGWRTKKIVGSNGMLDGMHDVLRDIIEALYKMPEHKAFAERHIEYWKDNPTLIKHYLPVKELNEYLEAEADYRNAMKNELWGITKGDYDKKLQQINDAQNRFNIEMEEHTKGDHQYHVHVGTVISLCRRMSDIFKSSEPSEKRAFLQFLLQNASADGKKLEFTMRKPFDAVLALAHHPTGLRDLDSNQDTVLQRHMSYH